MFSSVVRWRGSKQNDVPTQRGVHIFANRNMALVFVWRPHPAWESIFSLLQHLCSETDNFCIVCKNLLPMLRGARFFWRPHLAWESIFSLLQHLCSETINSGTICKNQLPMLRGARFFLASSHCVGVDIFTFATPLQ